MAGRRARIAAMIRTARSAYPAAGQRASWRQRTPAAVVGSTGRAELTG
ncbi:MAG TPA: hypothetical protein VF933_08870 [Streptosporangiaceae bacterium]